MPHLRKTHLPPQRCLSNECMKAGKNLTTKRRKTQTAIIRNINNVSNSLPKQQIDRPCHTFPSLASCFPSSETSPVAIDPCVPILLYCRIAAIRQVDAGRSCSIFASDGNPGIMHGRFANRPYGKGPYAVPRIDDVQRISDCTANYQFAVRDRVPSGVIGPRYWLAYSFPPIELRMNSSKTQ